MKAFVIKAQKREATGKKDSKKLRREGLVPCVIYGGEVPVHINADFKDFRQVIYTPNVYIIHLEIGNEVIKAIIQDMQWHPIEEQLLHVDFLLVKDDKPVKISLPVKTIGLAIGIKQGGKIKSNLRKLKVKGLVKDLPDSIDLNVEPLEVGQSIKIGDLNFEKLEFLENKSTVIVAVEVTRAVKTGETGAEGAAAEGGEAAKEKTES
jgi:large subunit ribosomal protein L25